MFKYGDKVQHRVTKHTGVCQGESIEHTGWCVVRWDHDKNELGSTGYCYQPDELKLIVPMESNDGG